MAGTSLALTAATASFAVPLVMGAGSLHLTSGLAAPILLTIFASPLLSVLGKLLCWLNTPCGRRSIGLSLLFALALPLTLIARSPLLSLLTLIASGGFAFAFVKSFAGHFNCPVTERRMKEAIAFWVLAAAVGVAIFGALGAAHDTSITRTIELAAYRYAIGFAMLLCVVTAGQVRYIQAIHKTFFALGAPTAEKSGPQPVA